MVGHPGEDGRVSDPARTHDVTVFGATGFVGRLLAAYLAGAAPAKKAAAPIKVTGSKATARKVAKKAATKKA